MSPDEPKKKPRFKVPGILIAISAASMLLGCGLCSAGGLNIEGDNTHPIVVGIGTAAFFGGLLALGVGVIWCFIVLVSGPSSQGKTQ